MRYLLLIHADEEAWASASPEEREETYADYRTVSREMDERGHMRGGGELAPATSAKLVRAGGGEVSVTDGPYAETREQLGGYFLVECDLDTALGYAAKIPAATGGTIEVRAVADGP